MWRFSGQIVEFDITIVSILKTTSYYETNSIEFVKDKI